MDDEVPFVMGCDPEGQEESVIWGTGLDDGVGVGSKMSRYFETIKTEMKYTIANERN